MEMFLAKVWPWITWLFEKGLGLFTSAWNTSRKATEIAVVGFVIFMVVVWLGWADRPHVDVAPDLTKQVSALTLAVEHMQNQMASKSDVSYLATQIEALKSKSKSPPKR